MDRKLDLAGAIWRKSSYSGTTGGDCIEIAQLSPCVAVRDSKNPDAGVFSVPADAFGAFVDWVR